MPIVLNGSGPITGVTSLNTTVSDTEIGYLDGVTSALQSQINTAGGLVKITDQAFSAVSSVNVNNCFTSTYVNYRIIILSDGTDFPNLQFRWRVAGSDNSTANSYSSQRLVAFGTTVTATRTTGTAGILGTLVNGTNVYAFDAFRPALATPTQTFSTNVLDESSGVQGETYATRHNQSTAYDGFSLLPATGTITGTLRVYGYRN